MRRNHSRAHEVAGEFDPAETGVATEAADVSTGDLSPPTLAGSLGKGSLGSEIIARVVVVRLSAKRGDRLDPRRKFRTHFVHSTTSEPECARPHRDNRYSCHKLQ